MDERLRKYFSYEEYLAIRLALGIAVDYWDDNAKAARESGIPEYLINDDAIYKMIARQTVKQFQ